MQPKLIGDIAVWFLVENAMLTIPLTSVVIGFAIGTFFRKQGRDWPEALVWGIAATALSALCFNQWAETVEYEAPVPTKFTAEEAQLVKRKLRSWMDVPLWAVETMDTKSPEYFRYSVKVSDAEFEIHAEEASRLIFISAGMHPEKEFFGMPDERKQALKKGLIAEFLRLGMQYDFSVTPDGYTVILMKPVPYNDSLTQYEFMSEAFEVVNALKLYVVYFRGGLQ